MTMDWIQSFGGAITVCDRNGVILSMNDRAIAIFSASGGDTLIGKSLLDCHPPAAQQKIKDMLSNQQMHAYTIQKAGKKKLVYQAPWYNNQEYMGIVELSFEIPFDMPHFNRDVEPHTLEPISTPLPSSKR